MFYKKLDQKKSLLSIVLYLYILLELFVKFLYNPVVNADVILNQKYVFAKSIKVHPPLRNPRPKHSDVVFSTRWKRDESIDVIKSFRASRVEWTYIYDPAYIQSLKNIVGWVGCTLSANIKTPNNEGVAQDFDGNQLVAPWMQSWGAKWVTTTNPLTRKGLFDWADACINAGADSIQFDDPMLQLHSVSWGGDFSPTSIAGFREYLHKYHDKKKLVDLGINDLHKFDYKQFLRNRYGILNTKDYLNRYPTLPISELWKDYLRETVIEFFREFRKHLDVTSKRRFPLSMNLGSVNRPNEDNQQFFLTQFVDYVIAETHNYDAVELYARISTLRSLGIFAVSSIAPISVSDGRTAISTLYALGAIPLVPWDVFVKTDNKGNTIRYFGNVEEFGDLYHFVRDHPNLFDSWEIAPVVGIVVPIDKYNEFDTMALVRNLVEKNVPFAFVPTGGRQNLYSIDEKRVENFGALVTVNQINDFSENVSKKLKLLKYSALSSADILENLIDSVTPFYGDDSEKFLLIPRVHKDEDRNDEIVIHVIPKVDQGSSKDNPSSLSIGIKSYALNWKEPEKIVWYSINSATKELKWFKSQQGISIELPPLREWGIAHIKLAK